MKKIDYIDEYIFASYFIPFISCDSLVMIISGVSSWGPYKIIIEGLQTRIVGLLIFIFVTHVFYVILIKWPDSLGKSKIKNKVLKNFILSPFLYLWVLAAVILFLSNINNLRYLKFLYIILILIVIKYQYIFINKIRGILNSLNDDNGKK